jgi:hypothetical protein
MGIRGSFPGGKAAGAWSWPLISILQYAFMAWCLVKHTDNFTLRFIFDRDEQKFNSSNHF